MCTLEALGLVGPFLRILLKPLLDDGQHNFELWVISGVGVWQSLVLGICGLCLLPLYESAMLVSHMQGSGCVVMG